MKLSERTHTALKFLNDGLGTMQVFQPDKDHYELRCGDYLNVSNCFNDHKEFFKKKVQLLTAPVCRAINLSHDKLMKQELLEQIPNGSAGTYVKGKYTYCYSLGNNDENVMFGFYENKMIFLIRASSIEARQITFFSETNYKIDFGDKYDYQIVAPYIMHEIFGIILFLRFAEIETKVLSAGQKVKEFNCKYVNDTKVNVEIVDSTWFTNLVKSDGFDVRGHFRLQAFGEGMKDRKMIWINPFHKSGYTAPARKY